MPARLIYEARANWRYATGTSVADDALFYQSPSGKTHIVVNELEYGHLKATATVDRVHSFSAVKKALGDAPLKLESMVAWLVSQEPKHAGATILVPGDFPAALYVKLRNAGLPVEVSTEDPFFPSRALKTADEIRHLKAAQKANETAFEHARQILKSARIQPKTNLLKWQGSTLTSEALRAEMRQILAKNNCTRFADMPYENPPIIACGPQSAIPHEVGHGPLKANQFIIIDCFPQHQNGYFADCTRTYLKGKPSEWQANLYHAVLVAQEMALKLIKPGVEGAHIHAAVEQFFEKAGYPAKTGADGRAEGFFHGLGHAVGLQLHDVGPRTLSPSAGPLQVGIVTSVEPGLYYPGKGGVRIEDVVVVTEKGHTNFAKLDKKNWLIP